MLIRVTVYPGASRELVRKDKHDKLELYLRDEAKNNAANTRARFVLAQYLNIEQKDLQLILGHRGRNKVFEITES